jgi:hypothetical protein
MMTTMKMRTTTNMTGVEMVTVAKNTRLEEMAALDAPLLKKSMKVIVGHQRGIVRKLVARKVQDVPTGRANISRNPIIKGRPINRNMVSLQHLRMVHSTPADFVHRCWEWACRFPAEPLVPVPRSAECMQVNHRGMVPAVQY